MRPDGHAPRVFVGTAETSGFIHAFADGFTRLGLEVTAGLRLVVDHFGDLGYDLDLSDDLDRARWSDVLARAADPRLRSRPRVGLRAGPVERTAWVVARHDVFVFVYNSLRADRSGDSPLVRGIGREFADLKRLGKRVVACFVGPDARNAAAYDADRGARSHDFVSLRAISASWGRDPIARAIRNVRRAELDADVILSQPNQASLALRPYHHLYAPLDLSTVRGRTPGREVPVVLHAPSNQGIKGTREILGALARLRAEGVRFDLRLLHGVAHAEVCAAMRDADVVIDQLHLPLHGRLGVEAMASGCALATADARDLEPVPPDRPIWPLTPSGLEGELRRLLTDRDLRVSLGRMGRAHARRFHDHVSVARKTLALVTSPTPAAADHHPTFFARSFELAPGETLPVGLRRATTRVATRCGLPDGVTLDDLARRGLAERVRAGRGASP